MVEKILPDYAKMPTWENYAKELDVEIKQSLEEGKALAHLRDEFARVFAMPDNEEKNRAADALFEEVLRAPQVDDYPYTEPSDLPSIRAESAPYDALLVMPEEERIRDKMHGGWLGRICGCLLGKPVEGIMSNELETILRRTGNYPMTRYIDKEEITPEVTEGVGYPMASCAYPRDFGRMPPDDDTNYMLIAYKLLRRYGRNFTPDNMADIWLSSQVKNAYCTAERVAYRNFVNGYRPPYSAIYKNPYREWIGAQIRGDVFGYVNPCDPETAADMAFRDASISHIKNGIYGEMFIAAMLAAAYGTDDIETIIRVGLSQIPCRSRLFAAVTKVIDGYHGGVAEAAFFADLHDRYDEHNGHDWTHTVSNAEIVTACLLYGGGDYARSVGMAVETGFDTDCNGATVGSILGVRGGALALPAAFTDRVCDTLESNLFGFARVSIREMAMKTHEIARGLRVDGNRVDLFGLVPDLTAGDALSYTLDMGDGCLFTDSVPSGYTYEKPGEYLLALTVRRANGERRVTRRVVIENTPYPAAEVLPICSVLHPEGGGSKDLSIILGEVRGKSDTDQYDSFTYGGREMDECYIGCIFRREKEIGEVIFTDGNHFGNGGWFRDGTMTLELLQNGRFVRAAFTCTPAYPVSNRAEDFGDGFTPYTLKLDNKVCCSGIRIRGIGGGSSGFISCASIKFK